MTPAKHHFDSGAKGDGVFPTRNWAQFRYRVNVHDGRTMDSNELSLRQFSLDIRHRLSNEVLTILYVETDIIALRFDPVDLVRGNDNDPSIRLKWQAFHGSRVQPRFHCMGAAPMRR